MKNPIKRSFQSLPTPGDAQGLQKPAPAAGDSPDGKRLPEADCEIPEINTDFMDNLFQDSTFLNRFDAAYRATEPMGLEPQAAAVRPGAPDAETPPVQNLLDIDFPGALKK